MLRQIEISARGNPLELLRAERKLVENIDRRFRVMCELLRPLPVFLERFPPESDFLVKAKTFLDPVFVPDFPAPVRLRLAGMATILDLRDRTSMFFDDVIGLDEEFEL